MKVVENRTSGKVHLPGKDSTTLCGAQLVSGFEENAHFRDDSWLDDFPEDYGTSMNDCETCAEIADLG